MNKEKVQVVIAWLLLMSLIGLFIYVNHLKFFTVKIDESTMEERPVENSSSEAIEKALTNIVNNFNKNPLIEQNKNNGVTLNATLNNYSIYITYTTDTTTTYEFNYSNLILSINITNKEENIKRFNTVYEILIEAVQERIGNEKDITGIVNSHLNANKNYDGLTKEINDKTIKYSIDITKELTEEGSE